MEKKLKSWQGWLLFCGAMAVVFVLGLVVSSLMERRAETVSVFNNKRVEITGIEARNEVFGENYPRQYETWKETAKTDFKSEFNGNEAVDVLEQRPEMVVLWANMHFQRITRLHGGTCMPLRTLLIHFVPVRRWMIKVVRSLLPAGLVRVRMCLA